MLGERNDCAPHRSHCQVLLRKLSRNLWSTAISKVKWCPRSPAKGAEMSGLGDLWNRLAGLRGTCRRLPSGTVGYIVLAGVVVFVILNALLGDYGPDSRAQLACDHFRNVMNDREAGILNYSGLRGKIEEVYDDARRSNHSDIRSAAQEMFAAVTAGEVLPDLVTDEGAGAVQAFDRACSRFDL